MFLLGFVKTNTATKPKKTKCGNKAGEDVKKNTAIKPKQCGTAVRSQHKCARAALIPPSYCCAELVLLSRAEIF